MIRYSTHCSSQQQFALLIFISLSSGCASQTAVLSGYSKPTAVPTFEITDARPLDERDTRFLSLATSSCDYGVRQIGDKDVVPDRITLLRDDLNAALGPELAHKRLVISHYGIYFNHSNSARNATHNIAGSSGGMVGGLLGGLMFKKDEVGSRCKRAEMKGGWFEASDVTTPYPPFIIEISCELDGQTHTVRSVYSTDKELTAASGNPETAAAMFAAIRKATDTLILNLRQK